MRNNSLRSPRINEIWNNGIFVGDKRPVSRITIQRVSLIDHPTKARLYRSMLMAQPSLAVELPNIKSIEIQRNASQDVASATIVFFNTNPLPVGATAVDEEDIDQKGYYTFNRGTGPNPWNYTTNEWINFLVPDRFLRTYQGYGIDETVKPHLDVNLLQTGTWLIDDVDFGTDGLITVTCRDIGGVLVDQHIYPPVVIKEQYPLIFQPYADLSTHPRTQTPTRVNLPGNYRDYTDIVKQLVAIGGFYWPPSYTANENEPLPPAESDPSLTAAAVDTVSATLSGDISFGFDSDVLTDAGKAAIADIMANTFGTNPTITVVGHASSEGSEAYNQDLSERRARSVKAYMLTIKPAAAISASGKGETEPIATNDTEEGRSANRRVEVTYTKMTSTPAAPEGRAYGDFMMSGTYAIAGLPLGVFDKKPIMDGVTYVKEILGFIFFIDERGGVIFRSPNIFKAGNYITNEDAPGSTYTTDVLTVDEVRHLKNYSVKLSNNNKRSMITVGTVDGRIRAEVPGYEPITEEVGPADERPLGLIRHAIWTDQHFANQTECQVMAEMIGLRLKQSYRVGRPLIAANPNLQPDDQIVVIERTTNEHYRHYVSGYTSTFDVETGTYDMSLETYWLGLA